VRLVRLPGDVPGVELEFKSYASQLSDSASKTLILHIGKIHTETTCRMGRLALFLKAETTMTRATKYYYSYRFMRRSFVNYCGGSGSAELVRGEVSE
jgi:hypothetical protein